MKFCIHEWKRIEEPQFSHFDYSGIKVMTAMCECTKCGKKKIRKFEGKPIGQLFG